MSIQSSPYESGYIDKVARREYLTLALATFLFSFMNAHSTLLAVVFQQDGYSLSAIGVLLSAIAAPVIVFALASGDVAARLGVLSTLRLAMALTLAGFFSLSVTRANFSGAFMSRVIQGAGQGLFLASAITYAQSRLTPLRMLFLLGVFSATMPLAQAIAPPFGKWTLERYGEQAMFTIAALPALLALCLTFNLRPLARAAARRKFSLLDGWKRRFAEPLIGVLLNGAMFGFCTAYLAAAFAVEGIPLALFFTSSAVAMFSARLLALRGLENANRRFLIATGLGLQALGFAAVAMAAGVYAVIMLGGVIFGVGYSLTYPVLSLWMSEGLAPAERAGPQAMLNGFFNIGLFAAPLPEVWLIAAYGYNATMLILAALALAFSLFLVIRGVSVETC